MNKFLILVVEDDAPVQNLITTTLKVHEYRFAVAGNGKTAISETASRNPDIILLDLGLMNGEEIHLTPIEYKLLCLLAKNTGKVLTHKFITQNVWGSCWDNDVASLRVFMATLRKKLEKKEDIPYIQTHIGIGYRMLRVE